MGGGNSPGPSGSGGPGGSPGPGGSGGPNNPFRVHFLQDDSKYNSKRRGLSEGYYTGLKENFGYGTEAANRCIDIHKKIYPDIHVWNGKRVAEALWAAGVTEADLFKRPQYDNGYVLALGTLQSKVYEGDRYNHGHNLAMKITNLMGERFRNPNFSEEGEFRGFYPFNYQVTVDDLRKANRFSNEDQNYLLDRIRELNAKPDSKVTCALPGKRIPGSLILCSAEKG